MKQILFALVLFLGPALALAQTPRELVGRYQLEAQGGDILDLRADGSATLAGDSMRWSARGNRLQVGSDVMTYALQGDRLIVDMGGLRFAWRRVGGGPESAMARAASRANASPATAPSGTNAQDVQIRQILTSSAWCSFTYNKTSGTSSTRRVVFHGNGVLSVNGGAETYSSGYGGSHAGQSSSAENMLWKVENLRLYIDPQNGGGFQDIGLTATRNSSGYLILQADGREYSVCN
jgi:hypothetical protein